MSRCTGHCCRKFKPPFSPGELQRLRKSVEDGTNEFVLDNGKNKSHKFLKSEVIKISDMVIFIERSEIRPETQENINDLISADRRSGQKDALELRGYKYDDSGRLSVDLYTCKHFNTSTGDCMDYQNRPGMCRNYPDGGSCDYKGCTNDCKEEFKK